MHLGGKNQLDAAIVEFVHQPDEAPAAVGLLHSEAPHAGNEHGMEAAGDFDVVGLAARTAAQFLEPQPCDTRTGSQGPDRPAFNFQLDVPLPWPAGNRLESLYHGGVGLCVSGEVEYPTLLQHAQAIVLAPVDLHDFEMLLQQP